MQQVDMQIELYAFRLLEKAATGLLSIKCNTLIKCRKQFSSLGYNFVAILISFTEKRRKCYAGTCRLTVVFSSLLSEKAEGGQQVRLPVRVSCIFLPRVRS